MCYTFILFLEKACVIYLHWFCLLLIFIENFMAYLKCLQSVIPAYLYPAIPLYAPPRAFTCNMCLFFFNQRKHLLLLYLISLASSCHRTLTWFILFYILRTISIKTHLFLSIVITWGIFSLVCLFPFPCVFQLDCKTVNRVSVSDYSVPWELCRLLRDN